MVIWWSKRVQQQLTGNTAGKAKIRMRADVPGYQGHWQEVGGGASLTSGVIDHEGVHSPRYSL